MGNSTSLLYSSRINHSQNFEGNLKDLRERGLKSLIFLQVLAAYVAAIRFFHLFHSREAGLMLGLLVGLIFAIPLRNKYPRLSAFGLLASAWIAVALEVYTNPAASAGNLFALVIVSASLVLSTWWVGFTGLFACAFLLVMTRVPGFGNAYLYPALIVCTMVTLIIWLGSRQYLSVLNEAVAFVHLAELSMEEARSDRGKLVQVVKALDEGNYRLQKAYQRIALARDEANQARELKIQFANMISHEMRAPLNFIIGVTDFMVNSPDLYGKMSWTPELMEDITRIYQSSKHLSNLIDDVLSLGQIEANRVALTFEASSIVEVIENVLVIIRPSYEHRGLYLDIQIGADIPFLMLDRVRIRQVFLNLLNNAYRFIKTGGVTIRVENVGSEVKVSVEDTGVGIPPDQIAKLFQDFYQVSDSSIESTGGSGLGLSISRQFIELHGGHIWVESPIQEPHDGQGSGTRFTFSIPKRNIATPLHGVENDRNFWNLQKKQSLANRSVIIFTELAVDDLLPNALPNFQLTVLDNREKLEYQLHALQPDAFIELSANNESSLEEKTHELLKREKTPYILCSLEQEDTGVNPLWDDYVVKPFTMARIHAVMEEICPEAHTSMLVDDDSNMQRYFELGLAASKQGIRLIYTDTGEKACSLLENETPDILFLDINLPDINGLKLLDQLKADRRFKNLPVVVLSAQNRPHLYKTRVSSITYRPAQMLNQEDFVNVMEALLNSIRFNTEI